MFKGRNLLDLLFFFALIALFKNIIELPTREATNKKYRLIKKQKKSKKFKLNNLSEIILELQKSIFTTKITIEKNHNINPEFNKKLKSINEKLESAKKRIEKKDTELFLLGPLTALSPKIKNRTTEKKVLILACELLSILEKLNNIEIKDKNLNLKNLVVFNHNLAEIFYLNSSITEKFLVSRTTTYR